MATTAAASAMPLERTKAGAPVVEKEPGIPSQRTAEAPLQLNRLKNFDLNCTYNDQEHCLEQHTATTATQQNGSLTCASWMVKQSSLSQMNGDLNSSSWQSLNSNINDQVFHLRSSTNILVLLSICKLDTLCWKTSCCALLLLSSG